MKYEAAFAQLQDIVRKMENDEFSIDEIAVQLKEAQRLIKFCKDKLTKTEAEIQKIHHAHRRVFAVDTELVNMYDTQNVYCERTLTDFLGILRNLDITFFIIVVNVSTEIPVQLGTDRNREILAEALLHQQRHGQ